MPPMDHTPNPFPPPIVTPMAQLGRCIATEALKHPAIRTRADLMQLVQGFLTEASACAPVADQAPLILDGDNGPLATARFFREVGRVSDRVASHYDVAAFHLVVPANDMPARVTQ